MDNVIKPGNFVIKKSKKPFKSTQQIEQVVSIGVNSQDPKLRECAIFVDGSVCNLDQLTRVKTLSNGKPLLEFYSWLFWFNSYQELWYAIPTAHAVDFFSGKHEGYIYFYHQNEDQVKYLILNSDINE